MKRYQFITLSILLTLLIVAVLITRVDASPLLGSGAPTVVSYQGVVKDGGSPYTGTGYFKFALVNAAGTTTYWSNDGSSTGGSEPDTYITLTVANGLFHALLGDTNLTNMTALPASAFSGTERYLRIWFSAGEITFTLLSPDQRIAAVPYALQAEEAIHAEYAADADTLDGLDSTDLYTKAEVDSLLAAYESRIAALETKLASVSVSGDDLYFTGVNVHVRNGTGVTHNPNGLGNLIVGYNESSGDTRTGSHNLVVGSYHSYTSYGGLIAGYDNTISNSYSSVSGGTNNTASGQYSSVSGGVGNTASAGYASVSGGGYNEASGMESSVSGGYLNTASSSYCSVSGGSNNTASGYYSSVSGGRYNVASGDYSSVLGGGGSAFAQGNDAWAHYSVIGGGRYNVAGDDGGTDRFVGEASAVLAGYANDTYGDFSSVSGGSYNVTGGIYAAVNGGCLNIANGVHSSICGGYSNEASGVHSSISGGYSNVASGTYSSVSGGVDNEAGGESSTIGGGANGIVTGGADWLAGTLFEEN